MVKLFRQYQVKQKNISFVLHWLVVLLLCHTSNLLANSDSYQLDKISQLDHHDISDKNWQQIVANPSNKEQFFVINSAGQLYLLDDTITGKPLLDLHSQQLASAEPNETLAINLTAMALHPSFSLRDQVGYGTFYTAHLEPINKKSRTQRLQERSADLTLKFDAVITEWQFNSVNHEQVDVSTKREVLRIAVPDEIFVINQLSFNPAIKSWNDDFGLLYIGLSGDKKWNKPLYSGVILRINPREFGLRSYTVPLSNPFLKDSQIKDAIYLLGGQDIQQFIWPDKNSTQLLVVHQYNQQACLSLTTGRDDWRVKAAKKVLYQSNEAIEDLSVYRGRELPNLRNKLLLLKYKEQGWQVESLVFNRSFSVSNNEGDIPQVEWQFTQQLSAKSEPSLLANLSGEILILDNNTNLLYRLSPENVAVNGNGLAETAEVPSSGNSLLMLFVFAMLAGACYYLVKRNKFSAKALVRQQYAHFEISEAEQQIGLYHRHESSAETMIDLVDIVSSEVQLNDCTVALINDSVGHGFTNDKERDLRAIFNKEHVDKMIDGKIRQISLILTVKQQHSYSICLYMRKGSDRITKKSYWQVVDDLIDWCWLVGIAINAEQMGKRTIKPMVKSAPATAELLAKESNASPLHNQAAAIRPVTRQKSAVDIKPNAEVNLATEAPVTDNLAVKATSSKHRTADEHKNSNSTIDTELVNALEKLVSLKQQGFLTMDEFAQAKAKLLKNLFD